jgi:hypothetical protein
VTRTVISLLAILGFAAFAAAGEPSARLVPEAIWTDQAAEVRIVFPDADLDITKLSLAVPPGFRVEGPFGGARRISVVNGVRESSVEFGFRVMPPADADGTFPIGPVTAEIRGQASLVVAVGELRVGRRPAAAVRFTVEAVPPSGPVGAPVLLRYRVLYSGEPFLNEDAFGQASNPLGLTRLVLAVLGDNRVRVEEGPASPGAASLRIRDDFSIHVTAGSATVDGGLWRTLEFSLKAIPLEPGDVPIGGEVGLALVAGKERRQDFFGRVVLVPSGKEHRASAGEVFYRVAPLPVEGRPAGFTGAVGRFRITATASPTEVNAFDPVEVSVIVSGDGLLDRIALPRFGDFPEIARDFEVDADTDPGKVEGGEKRFRVVMRPRSASVTALPALPFPYFDPAASSYEVARSAPIPLTVHEVRTVRPEEAVGPALPAGGEAPSGPVRPLAGIAANYDRLSGGSGRLAPPPPLFTPGFAALLAVPPLLAGLAFLLASRRRRGGAPRGTALGRALGTVRDAASAEEAAAAFGRYFAEKLALPDGELTTSELGTALAARMVPAEIAGRVLAMHERIVAARFAGGGGAPEGWAEALREVDRCLP